MVIEAGLRGVGANAAIDYRRAPEHPYRLPMKTRSRLGASCAREASQQKTSRSAATAPAGNLALGLISRLRAAGEGLPALRLAGLAMDRPYDVGRNPRCEDAIDPLIHRPTSLTRGRLCAGLDRSQGSADLAAVCRSQGVPPLLIQVGSAETLLADATRFAALQAPPMSIVRLEIWPHMIHAWPVWTRHWKTPPRA